MRALPLTLSFVLCCPALNAQQPAGADAKDSPARLRAHVEAHRSAPTPYLLGLLKKHDVVVLGETHGVRQTTAFVRDVLPELYRHGELRVFATEFLRARFTERANELVRAEQWDEAAMVELMRAGPWPTWGYRGYLEIYEAIWKLHRGLPKGAAPLELVGMDSDWSQYDNWFGKLSRAERFRIQLEREKCMTEAVRRHGLAAHQKTLVHIGFAHSVTCHGIRCATVLRKEHGDRVVQLAVHHALRNSEREQPVTERLERLLGDEPCALPVRGTPLGELRDPDWPFARALPHGNLGDLMEHLLYLAPVSRQLPERWIDGFVTKESYERARAIAERMRQVEKGACKDAGQLDAALAAQLRRKSRRRL